jgi:23S rRNA (cytosine1962-C5)-methyltransferase
MGELPVAKVNKKAALRIAARHCWIYRSDLSAGDRIAPGEIVRVVGPRGEVLGSALYSSRSQIALRMLSFDGSSIDGDFWASRLIAAEQLRQQVSSGRDAYRLVFGESDLLPSLIIDRYLDCFVIQTLSQGMELLKPLWIQLIADLYHPKAIIERNEARVREMEGLPRTAGIVFGDDPGQLVIKEGRFSFCIDLIRGQKTGWFLDQSDNRIAAEIYARGRVLDCFTFQGGFAVHMSGGADHVLAIDVSGAALESARKNVEINAISSIEFAEANVFDKLSELETAGQRFDVIVLDPPAFAKNRASVEAAARGYKEINLRALKMLEPGGTLVTSTCSYHMSEDAFLNILADAASDAHRVARIVEKRTQSRDHPILITMPETYYLKCVVLSVQ